MDAISIHPYRQPHAPEDSGYEEDIREIGDMCRRRGRELPIWITEVGWPNGPDGSTEARSAQMLPRAYLLALANGVRNITWYDFHDDGPDRSYNEHNFGVIRYDMTPKPAYFAFRAMAVGLAGASFERRLDGWEGVTALVFRRGGNRPPSRCGCPAWGAFRVGIAWAMAGRRP
jgi:hypothetical protein